MLRKAGMSGSEGTVEKDQLNWYLVGGLPYFKSASARVGEGDSPVVRSATERQARQVLDALGERIAAVRLALHPTPRT